MKKIVFVFSAVLSALILTGCPEPKSDPEPEPVVYALRDTGPAGGLIFYIDEADEFSWDYLEAAPVSTERINKEWGSFGTLIGGTGTAIGDGIANTTTVATWLDTNSESDRAAQVCRDLTEGGYSWFLPSIDELDKMYVNLHSGTDENSVTYTPVGDFADFYYWSSSEYANDFAWILDFGSGNQNDDDKDDATRLRAIRAF